MSTEYSIYARLCAWGYDHKRVKHGGGEYARDEDGDGFCEVRVNTMEGFWSLWQSWLRPHRGISQEKPPLYLGFFAFVHNARKRGKPCLVRSLSYWAPKTLESNMSRLRHLFLKKDWLNESCASASSPK
jgi:transposase